MADILRSASLDGIPHGFSTRTGLAAADVLPGGVAVLVKQVHSAQVVTVDATFEIMPEADALVTSTPGLVLGIVTADCAPVLLADIAAGVVGAAHAGWRGAHGGVIANTIAAMTALGANSGRMRAAIGPCIAPASYEVDARFRATFDQEAEPFFSAGRKDHWQFDLPGYVAARLRACGIGAIDDLALDTYADPQRFHSYRRATHRGTSNSGRQVSFIAVPD